MSMMREVDSQWRGTVATLKPRRLRNTVEQCHQQSYDTIEMGERPHAIKPEETDVYSYRCLQGHLTCTTTTTKTYKTRVK